MNANLSHTRQWVHQLFLHTIVFLHTFNMHTGHFFRNSAKESWRRDSVQMHYTCIYLIGVCIGNGLISHFPIQQSFFIHLTFTLDIFPQWCKRELEINAPKTCILCDRDKLPLVPLWKLSIGCKLYQSYFCINSLNITV